MGQRGVHGGHAARGRGHHAATAFQFTRAPVDRCFRVAGEDAVVGQARRELAGRQWRIDAGGRAFGACLERPPPALHALLNRLAPAPMCLPVEQLKQRAQGLPTVVHQPRFHRAAQIWHLMPPPGWPKRRRTPRHAAGRMRCADRVTASIAAILTATQARVHVGLSRRRPPAAGTRSTRRAAPAPPRSRPQAPRRPGAETRPECRNVAG